MSDTPSHVSVSSPSLSKSLPFFATLASVKPGVNYGPIINVAGFPFSWTPSGYEPSSGAFPFDTLSSLLSTAPKPGMRATASDAPGSMLYEVGGKWTGFIGEFASEAALSAVGVAEFTPGAFARVSGNSWNYGISDGTWSPASGTPTFGSYAKLVATGGAPTPGTMYYYIDGGVVKEARYDAEAGWVPLYSAQSFNVFKDSSLQSRIASVIDSGGVFTIACVGESTTKGIGTVLPYNAGANPTPFSWPHFMAKKIRENYGMQVSEVHIPASTGDYDSQWESVSGFVITALGCALKTGYEASVVGSKLKIKPSCDTAWNSATVWFLRSPLSNGKATAIATGGAATEIVSQNVQRDVYSVTCHASKLSMDNEIEIDVTESGSVWIYAFEVYDSTRGARIRVANLGVGASTTGQWTSVTGGGVGGWWMVNALSPDLTLLCLGGSESSSGVPASTHIANMQTLINNLTTSTKIGILPITPRDTDAKRLLVDEYVSGYSGLSGSKILNFAPSVWGAWRNAHPPSWAGGVHLGGIGYKFCESLISNEIFA